MCLWLALSLQVFRSYQQGWLTAQVQAITRDSMTVVYSQFNNATEVITTASPIHVRLIA